MWTFTGYILWKLYERGRSWVALDDIVRLVFGRMWKRYNLVLNESHEELLSELKYIAELGYIELDLEEGRVLLKPALKDFEDVVGKSPLMQTSRLYSEYVERIGRAVEEHIHGGG